MPGEMGIDRTQENERMDGAEDILSQPADDLQLKRNSLSGLYGLYSLHGLYGFFGC